MLAAQLFLKKDGQSAEMEGMACLKILLKSQE